jgi:hypothetical protein
MLQIVSPSYEHARSMNGCGPRSFLWRSQGIWTRQADIEIRDSMLRWGWPGIAPGVRSPLSREVGRRYVEQRLEMVRNKVGEGKEGGAPKGRV